MDEAEVYEGDQNLPLHCQRVQQLGHLWSSLKKTLFVVGSTLVVLVALRNSITFHLQQFWGASGNFWQHQWDQLLDKYGDDPFNLLVYGTTIVTYIVFWTVASIYIFMDVTNKPACLRRYKIQPGMNEPVETWRLIKCILLVNFNQIVVGVPVAIFGYYLMMMRGFNQSHQLPTFHWVLFELMICILGEEVGFYYSHRLFHHRTLYKHFHKMHHEWQSPISIIALYAHPLEHAMSNMLPSFLGPFLLGSHIATCWLWFCLALMSTLNAHSGYHFPFFPSPEAHDYHHLKFNQCYGVLGVLDHLHGTDDKFRTSKNFTRNFTMLSLVPVREAVPDDKPKGKIE
ncbi:fatty acid hydroxylase domain-containing protein 2-like [Oratosquilla oratoria]|uniref:fatty acid hydroxylase domain-containing protein 2-like n=1 Tax=Oratosquilla oratoria TaxID=337810 RepID=UPI003F769204